MFKRESFYDVLMLCSLFSNKAGALATSRARETDFSQTFHQSGDTVQEVKSNGVAREFSGCRCIPLFYAILLEWG